MVKKCDTLILGTGIGGLSTALKLAESGQEVIIVTREEKPESTNTYWAQGGIIYNKQEESTLLVEDILKASGYTSNVQAANVLSESGHDILEEVLIKKIRTHFTQNENNQYLFTKEAAHSTERILYQGDYTGKEIQLSLLNYLDDKKRFPKLTFLTSHTAIDLITPEHHGTRIEQRYEKHQVVGAYLFNQREKQVVKVMAKQTVLATGGIGGLYIHNSNTKGARGDGHAMAYRAGARVVNMEFVQFHPTTFFSKNAHRRFLISEAVRGEGGILRNSKGERFMERYHHDMELAPRDIVARAIWDEMILQGDDCVYLDITDKKEAWLQERFPSIFEYCLERGFNLSSDLIPVVPAAHYSCGGIKTDLKGRTNVQNLFAVGEVACTGLHGANRLASTSLLEGLTFGYLAAEEILKNKESSFYDKDTIQDWNVARNECDLALVQQDWLQLRQTMWNYVGIKRSKSRLARAEAMFEELSDEIHRFYKHVKLHDELIGLRNAVEVAMMVVRASKLNKEPQGCFYLEP